MKQKKISQKNLVLGSLYLWVIRARFRSSVLWGMGPPRLRCAILMWMKGDAAALSTLQWLLAMAHGANIRCLGCAPVPLYREAALLWGLGREASRELPGQEARHIHCPGCGQPLRVRKKTNSTGR